MKTVGEIKGSVPTRSEVFSKDAFFPKPFPGFAGKTIFDKL